MKDERIMTEFVGLRAKTYSFLKDNNDGDKKAKATKKCVIKRKLEFQDYKKDGQKQLKLEIKLTIQKKIKLMQIILKNILKKIIN